MAAPRAEIDLNELSTPSNEWLALPIGEINQMLVDQAEERRFDQIPVLSQSGDLKGVISTRHVRELLEARQQLLPDDPAISFALIQVSPPLLELLQKLSASRALFFRANSNPEQTDCTPGEWHMITISDLNRHSFRSHLYPIFAELENRLADVLQTMFKDHWDWLKHLDEGVQSTLIGNWEISKLRSVDTGVLTGCTLTNLLTVASKDARVRETFFADSKNQFDKIASRIKDVRNKIMHPVRPLILGTEDVEGLHDTLASVVKMSARLATSSGSRDTYLNM